MALRPDLQYWALGGHGRGGTVAAGLAPVLYPKVKGLFLLAAALPGKTQGLMDCSSRTFKSERDGSWRLALAFTFAHVMSRVAKIVD